MSLISPVETETSFLEKVQTAFAKREALLSSDAQTAGRLFHGFSEGFPTITLDLYDRTAVINVFKKDPKTEVLLGPLCSFIRKSIPRLRCILLKERYAKDITRQKGTILFGQEPDREIREWDVRYKIDPQINQDASFYLDSANLRKWLIDHAAGASVLNTFAYTGSFGTAALAGEARFVLQTDLSTRFLRLFSETAAANNTLPERYERLPGNFFHVAATLRRQQRLFDIGILDPPFFSATSAGRVDQQQQGPQLVNKLRPLIADGGKIIVLNNALYLSGRAFLAQIEGLCADGYLAIEEIIPVPESFFGGETKSEQFPTDPAPFNHPTKIIILGVRRKDERKQ